MNKENIVVTLENFDTWEGTEIQFFDEITQKMTDAYIAHIDFDKGITVLRMDQTSHKEDDILYCISVNFPWDDPEISDSDREKDKEYLIERANSLVNGKLTRLDESNLYTSNKIKSEICAFN